MHSFVSTDFSLFHVAQKKKKEKGGRGRQEEGVGEKLRAGEGTKNRGGSNFRVRP